MNCSECFYWDLTMNEYPCSGCSNHDMFRDAKHTAITPEDIMMLIHEIRQLRKLVEKELGIDETLGR